MRTPLIVLVSSTLLVGYLLVHADDPDAPHRKPEDRSIWEQTLKITAASAVWVTVTSSPGPFAWRDRK